MSAERSLLETLCLSSKLEHARLLLLVNRGGPIKRGLVLRKCPAPKARLREAPSMQLRPAPSQAWPSRLFARLLCNFVLAFARQVRFLRHRLQCQARTKYKQTVPGKAAE